MIEAKYILQNEVIWDVVDSIKPIYTGNIEQDIEMIKKELYKKLEELKFDEEILKVIK